jgi:transposase-like protein
MDFPIADLMDEGACYARLVQRLHPEGLACPRCRCSDGMKVHRRDREPVVDYRCGRCRCVFNAYTGTALRGTKRRPVALMLILRGFAQGVPTAQLARELECDRVELLRFRHRLQDLAFRNRDLDPLDDEVLGADEAYQNAGEKRGAAPRPGRPAATAGEQAARPRDLGERPPADRRRRGPGEREGPAGGGRQRRWPDVAAGRAAGDLADGRRQHR